MNKIINFVAGLALGKKAVESLTTAQAFLSGKKSYVAGSILVLQGVLCLIGLLEEAEGVAGLLDLAKSLPSAPCVSKIAEGLGIIGLRAGLAKS